MASGQTSPVFLTQEGCPGYFYVATAHTACGIVTDRNSSESQG